MDDESVQNTCRNSQTVVDGVDDVEKQWPALLHVFIVSRRQTFQHRHRARQFSHQNGRFTPEHKMKWNR